MFQTIEYNNYPFIISSGTNFATEIALIKNKILPKIKSLFSDKKYFCLNFYDSVYMNAETKCCQLNDLVLLNLDAINQNGSICICLLGEKFEEPNFNRKTDAYIYAEKLSKSMKVARDSGYPWIDLSDPDINPSLLEVLSLHAGLMSGVKFPLFYFRVSGSDLDVDGQGQLHSNANSPNEEMERLKQKLIRNGLPIKFYGSENEFTEAAQSDLIRIFSNFPNKLDDRDVLLVDQQCYEHRYTKDFIFNDNILRIFKQLDCVYNSLKEFKDLDKDSGSTRRIDELIKDFYRKEFSDKLSSAYNKLRTATDSAPVYSADCENTRVIVLTGPRGSGKSTLLINWFNTKKESGKIIFFTHYCKASFFSSDLRILLRRMITNIRSFCGYDLEQDDHEMHSLDTELTALSQELLGAMLLAKSLGYLIIIIIDGLDHLGDKCSRSMKKIKYTDWIPESVPDNARIIMSCTTSDSSLTRLREKRSDLALIDMQLDVEGSQNNLLEAGVHGLKLFVDKYNQTFPDNMVQGINDWPLIKLPLVQKILAHVHHTLGTTSSWKQFIIKASECQTLVELVRRVLKLHIQFLNWEAALQHEKLFKKKSQLKKEDEDEDKSVLGWVPDCLSLLALSRNGLEMETILSCLSCLGFVKEAQVSELDLWRLFHLTREIVLGFHNNRLIFTHFICKEIVEHTFLAIASCSSVNSRTQETNDWMYIDKRCKLHILLAYQLWRYSRKDESILLDCLYHLDMASDHGTLAKLMFQPRVLMKLFHLSFNNITIWQGHLRNTHQFQFYWYILKEKGFDLVESIRLLLYSYFNLGFHEIQQVSNETNSQVKSEISPKHQSKTYFQSNFAKKLSIPISSEIEKTWSPVNDNEKNLFLFLVGQVCSLVGLDFLARNIYNHIERVSINKILCCQVLWMDIRLDCSFHDVLGNDVYIHSVLSRLDDLTASIIQDELDYSPHLLVTVKYIRCLCLVLKCSISLTRSNQQLQSEASMQLNFLSKDIKSVILNTIIKELEYNSIELRENLKIVQEKMVLLSDIIVKLEIWLGPGHGHMAKLFVKLAQLLQYGNSQSRFKAEACCRRALSIWKLLQIKDECQYNAEEDECREILFALLLKDPCNSSLVEAKTHIYHTFDSRMKFLGCYHPLTAKLVPVIKLVNSLGVQFARQLHLESERLPSQIYHRNVRGSLSSRGNQSNVRTQSLASGGSNEVSRPQSSYRSKEKWSSETLLSLQFINRYSNDTDCFNEEVDWNSIATSRPSSILDRPQGTVSANSLVKKYSSLSYDANTPLRRQSSLVNSNLLRHVYCGPNSSCASLTMSPHVRHQYKHRHSRSTGGKAATEKQVKFGMLDPLTKKRLSRDEISAIIQFKLQNMKSAKTDSMTFRPQPIPIHLSSSVNSVIDPIL